MDSNNEITIGSPEYYKQYLKKERTQKRIKNTPYILVLILLVLSVYYYNSNSTNKNNSFKTTVKNIDKYNLNIQETINLDNIYQDKNIKWHTNNDNIEINNNTITAIKEGTSKVTALNKYNNKKYEAEFYVLPKENHLSMKKHFIETSVDKKIKLDLNNTQEININDTKINFVNQSNNIIYNISNPKNASIDNDGNLTANKVGTVKVEVKDENGNNDYGYVKIIPDKLDIDKDSLEMTIGEENKLPFTLTSDTYKKDDIKWSSENEEIVTVNEAGNIIAKGVGEANVTIYINDTISDTIKISVKKQMPKTLTLSTDYLELEIDDTEEVVADITPTENVDNTITWTTNNNEIVSCDEGLITALKEGEATITATTVNGLTKEIKVKVKSPEIEILPEQIVVEEESINMIVDEIATLDYYILPEETSYQDVSINYDNNIIEVDENDNIKALAPGETTLRLITTNNITKEVKVNIEPQQYIETSNIELSTNNLNILVGETKKVNVEIKPANSSEKKLTWKSSNPSIVTVNDNGEIKGVSQGLAYIIVKSGNISKTIDINCGKASNNQPIKKPVINSNNNITKITLSNYNLNLLVGTKKKINATVYPTNTANKSIKWISNNPSIVTVDSNGNITTLKEGTAKITAISQQNNNITATCTVKVRYNLIEKMNNTLKYYNSVLQNDRKNGKHWVYSNSSKYTPQNGTFKSAASQKSNRLGGNCATSANWLLKDIGAIKSSTKFYGNSNGGITTNNMKDLKRNTNIYHYGSKTVKQAIKEGKIVPGDIICTTHHTFTYMGDYIFDSGRLTHGEYVGKKLGRRSEYYNTNKGVFEFHSWITKKGSYTYNYDINHYKAYNVIRVKKDFKSK